MSSARHLVVSRICKTSQGLVDSLVFSCGYFPHVCVDNMCFAECDLFGFCRWATATSITVVISSSARRCWDHCEFSAAIMVIAFPFISGHNWSCARIDLGARHTHVNHHGWPCSFLYVQVSSHGYTFGSLSWIFSRDQVLWGIMQFNYYYQVISGNTDGYWYVKADVGISRQK